MKFQKAQAGDPLSVHLRDDTWNAFIDAAIAHREGGRTNFEYASRSEEPANTIAVRNDSGENIAAHEIIGLDSVLITPTDGLATFKRRVLMSGKKPTTASHTNKFAIAAQAIPDGKIGLAYADGYAVCQIDVGDSSDTHADVKNNDFTQLESGTSGTAQIIWKESGTGTKWAVVRISQGATGAAAAGASAYTVAYIGTDTQYDIYTGTTTIIWSGKNPAVAPSWISYSTGTGEFTIHEDDVNVVVSCSAVFDYQPSPSDTTAVAKIQLQQNTGGAGWVSASPATIPSSMEVLCYENERSGGHLQWHETVGSTDKFRLVGFAVGANTALTVEGGIITFMKVS